MSRNAGCRFLLPVSGDGVMMYMLCSFQREGGVTVTVLVSFIISILASVVAYYICKWLDGDE